ncbi:MAG: hypothetical protein OEW75_11740 [Cyclobacteriaceae bacterium]|nr:hypothetical protein [Cyclobacteriaceae bacterium]
MFTEYEVQTFLEIPEITSATEELRRQFIKSEAPYLEISTHDFLSLILMTPAVGIAYANGSISLFEEISLNKMARKMSKGGYFWKSDPVARAMKFFIKSFDKWEDRFMLAIKLCMNKSFDAEKVEANSEDKIPDFESFSKELMGTPNILVRYLTAFFLYGENEIVEVHSISKVEYEKVLDIGKRLEIDHLHVFKSFLTTFKVK